MALLALVAFCATWVGAIPGAAAAVRLTDVPSGWEPAGEEAQARAQVWADALEGQLRDIYGPQTDEGVDFIAVISVPGQLTAKDQEDPTGYLTEFASIFEVDSPASASALELYEDAPPALRGRFEDGEDVFEVAVVSSGDSRGLVVFATTIEDEKLYASLFDTALDNLTGLAAPLAPFPHRQWWTQALIGWLIVIVVLTVIVRVAGSSRNSATQVGRRVAATCVLLAVVAMAVAYYSLAGSKEIVEHSGLSRAWLVSEIGLIGLGGAGLVLIIASILSASVRPVQSAPSTGTWGERPLRPAIPVVPPDPRLRPTHPDGAGSLTTAGEPDPPQEPPAATPVPLPEPSHTEAIAATPASRLDAGKLESRPVLPRPAAAGSGVYSFRTAPIVLRGSDGLPTPPPTQPDEPKAPAQGDVTLVGRAPAPRVNPLVFPAPMTPEDDGNSNS